jgi:hypothetical protein
MNKYIISLLVLGLFAGHVWGYDQEFVDAHQWMYEYEMTKYAQVADFQPNSWVTREQAAKFFLAFDRVVMGREAFSL